MNNYEYTFWIFFKEEFCVNKLKYGSHEMTFLKKMSVLDWNIGSDSQFSKLPRGLVKGDVVSYAPFYGDQEIEGYDYKFVIDGDLIVTKVEFSYGADLEETNTDWHIHVDCYCDRFFIVKT